MLSFPFNNMGRLQGKDFKTKPTKQDSSSAFQFRVLFISIMRKRIDEKVSKTMGQKENKQFQFFCNKLHIKMKLQEQQVIHMPLRRTKIFAKHQTVMSNHYVCWSQLRARENNLDIM